MRQDVASRNDWNQPGRVEDFLPFFADWRFDWLDVTRLITTARQIFEYPMVDKDPVPRWTFGRITLLGDAAHPMYPRGSNGSAQALIDASTLAEELTAAHDPMTALRAYEARRIELAARIVQTNRTVPPDFIIMRADELSGGRPIGGGIDSLISQAELRRISEDYKRIAGFSLEMLRGVS